jgi:acyl-CoA thioesterase-1
MIDSDDAQQLKVTDDRWQPDNSVGTAHCTRRGFSMGLACVIGGALLGVVSAQAAKPPARILVMGDSLSAEYGIARGSGWVALLEARLKQQKRAAEVVNASISGETTAGGHARLPPLLQTHQPTHVIIELGSNDALQGKALKNTRANLQAMIAASQAAHAKVMLIGMMVPPNYGKRYAEDFFKIYDTLAREHQTALLPFLLKDIADRPDAKDWFQPDGLHPIAKAHPIILEHVWAVLEPLL